MFEFEKISSSEYPEIKLCLVRGHFVTPHSHINHYIDMTAMRSKQVVAQKVAKAIAKQYVTNTCIDTILCMDKTEVIGAYLAEYLSEQGIMSINMDKTINICTPEFNNDYNGCQIVFRDNIQPMIRSKHVLVLLGTATTGKTLSSAIEVVKYYGGEIAGISAIFSAAESVQGIHINALFTQKDIIDYKVSDPTKCEMCERGQKIDALVNGFGYTQL
jgi:orotate phosphoribosyltransferase